VGFDVGFVVVDDWYFGIVCSTSCFMADGRFRSLASIAVLMDWTKHGLGVSFNYKSFRLVAMVTVFCWS
jgi:hypothetical protein